MHITFSKVMVVNALLFFQVQFLSYQWSRVSLIDHLETVLNLVMYLGSGDKNTVNVPYLVNRQSLIL